MWSKIKEALSASNARTRKKLRIEIAGALLTVSPQDAAGWFAHVATVFSNVR